MKPELPCRCCSSPSFWDDEQGMTRRAFLEAGAAMAGGVAVAGLAAAQERPNRQPQVIKLPLKVQPVLVYQLAKRREAASWRSWGGLMTEQDVAQEKERIARELQAMSATDPKVPIEMLPLQTVQSVEQATALAQGGHDALLMYAASAGIQVYEPLANPEKWNIMFVRHRSGPVYLWYEIAHPRFLRKTVDEYGQKGMTVDDVVVDSPAEVAWRLRALYALKNTLGKRIVAVGGPAGWGAGGKKAPDISRNTWKLDIQTVSYPELGQRIERAKKDEGLVAECHAAAARYLRQKGVSLQTSEEFFRNSFVLTEVFKELLAEAGTDAITINQCMGTIMPIAKTTACMPLSLLNDDGFMAFCESDFVVIPSGILLRYISDRPVFLNDPTYPHDGVVTLAHCTAPRKMDAQRQEPVKILTHFESDYGAAPKVEMRKGQRVTNLIPDFACRKWVGVEGDIIDAPFLPICRSQIDVRIHGDCRKLVEEMKGFHWMTCYGSHLRETGYALRKLGIDWLAIA